MAFNVLAITVVAAVIWLWRGRSPVQARHARDRGASSLPYDDLPPIGAFEPLPPDGIMERYVQDGLERLSAYLSGRDKTL
jgi:hypothetical protein